MECRAALERINASVTSIHQVVITNEVSQQVLSASEAISGVVEEAFWQHFGAATFFAQVRICSSIFDRKDQNILD